MYSRTPSSSGVTRNSSLTGRPQPRSRSYQPEWVSGAVMPAVAPTPCRMSDSGRVAVTRGSFCRSEPAAELRGLANGGLPASVSRSFSSWNAATGRNTSPRTSSSSGTSGPASRSGTAAIVRMLGVTSSPVTPSPRVAARTSAPLR